MEFITFVIDLFLHLDKHLSTVIIQFGGFTYFLLFFVIFMETGFVVTPFLPGDSLLFAAGTLASLENVPLHIGVLYFVMAAAAVLGDTANYWIGHAVGPRVFSEKVWFLKKEHLDRTHRFYEKHGGITIFLARFIPIIRTFAPFVAGIGEMTYPHFLSYNILGGAGLDRFVRFWRVLLWEYSLGEVQFLDRDHRDCLHFGHPGVDRIHPQPSPPPRARDRAGLA